jgi:hypothetical protein
MENFNHIGKTIRILHADKGNCMVVLDECEYKQNLGSTNPSLRLLLRENYRNSFQNTKYFCLINLNAS